MLRTRATLDGPPIATPARRTRAVWSRVWAVLAMPLVAACVAYFALTPLAPFATDPAGNEWRRHLVLSAVFAGYGITLLLQRRLPRGSAIDGAALAMCVAVLLAAWRAADPRPALEWPLAVLPLAPLAVIARDRRLFSARALRRGIVLGAVVAAVPAYASVWRQWQDWLALVRTVEGGISFSNLLPPAAPRVAGVGSHPNVLGAVLALSLPVAVASLGAARQRERVSAAIALVVISGALFFTLSRTAWAAALAGCPVAAVLMFGGRPRSRRVLPAVAAGTALVGVVAVVLASGVRPGWLYRDSLDPRADMRRVGVEMFRDSPVTGAGPGSYAMLYAAHGGKFPFAAVHAHNTAIQIAADTGIIGLAAAATLLVVTTLAVLPSAISRAAERRRSVAVPAGVVVAFLVDGLADSPHLYPDVLLVLALATAMLPDATPPPQLRTWMRLPRALTARAAGTVLVAGALALLPLWWWTDRGASLYQQSVRETAAGRRDEGIRLAEQAIRWDGGHTAYRAQLAAALSSRYLTARNTEDRDRAIATYQQVLARQPHLAAALVDLAALQIDRGEREPARQTIDQLRPLTGGDRLLQTAYAALLEQAGTAEQAIEAYAGLLVLDPTLAATPLFHTGFRQERQGAIVERALARVAELGGTEQAQDGRRAAIRVYAGRAAPDERVVRRALAAGPDDPGALVALGRVLLAQGRLEDAGEPLHRAVARTGDSVEAREALGDWYRAIDNLPAARHEWMIAAWLGSARALDALGNSYAPATVPPAIIERQRRTLAAVLGARFGLLAQNFRFAFQRQEPAPVIAQGDWLLAVPDDLERWTASVARWTAQRPAAP